MKAKGRIAIGMSGGIDSSVSALLLKDAGFDIIGITMLLRPAAIGESDQSLLKESNDAALVCKELGIEHFVLDYKDEFRSKVIGNFIKEYCAGRTHNPCVLCNKNLKFGKLLEHALSLGCSHVATGHYAKIESIGNRFLLKKADSPKDQSYFLYNLNQHQLSHTMFPLFFEDKQQARDLAKLRGLPTAEKSDSQDICFIKNGDYAGFLEQQCHHLPPSGNFIDSTGNIMGKHAGIYNYTVGQRKGLGAFGHPVYVCDINPNNNTVTLCKKGEDLKDIVQITNVNLIPFDTLTDKMSVEVKLRYRAKPVKAELSMITHNSAQLLLHDPQPMVTPGQSAVFYTGDTVVGGGIIL